MYSGVSVSGELLVAYVVEKYIQIANKYSKYFMFNL